MEKLEAKWEPAWNGDWVLRVTGIDGHDGAGLEMTLWSTLNQDWRCRCRPFFEMEIVCKTERGAAVAKRKAVRVLLSALKRHVNLLEEFDEPNS